jgi:hypothetical protein
LAQASFTLQPVLSTFVHIGLDKRGALAPELRARFDGRALHQYGEYLFGEVHVIEIARLASHAAGTAQLATDP